MVDRLVSVIVPVYNVKPYLKECVDSILRQTYENLEIILVDDGSTDGSENLCDEYIKTDWRVKVIHKENGGLSDARNLGMAEARGEILSFVDSDDYISEFFYEIMLTVMNENDCDIVALESGIDFWDESGARANLISDIDEYSYEIYPAVKVLERMFYQQIATGAPFKIYKKEVFNGIQFPKGYLYEDVATTYKPFLNAYKAGIVKADIYAYRKRNTSIIRQPFSEDKMIVLTIFGQLLNDNELKKVGMYKAAVSRVYAMLYSVFLQIPRENAEARNKVWNMMKTVRYVVAFNNNLLMRRKNKYGALISYFGMDVAYYIGRRFGQKRSFQNNAETNSF